MEFQNSCVPSGEVIRCAIYARTASEHQFGNHCTDRQIDLCKAAARMRGWTVVENYIRADRGNPGTSLRGRRRLQQLITLAVTNPRPFDYLICDSVNRVSWRLGHFSAIVDTLTHNGVGLYFVKDNLYISALRSNDRFYILSDFDRAGQERLRHSETKCQEACATQATVEATLGRLPG
jgi:DNA invertase Pin-like site-specific DNA recombinase